MTAPNGRANGSAIDNPKELVAPTVRPTAVMSPTWFTVLARSDQNIPNGTRSTF
jgi:hypothetical protein